MLGRLGSILIAAALFTACSSTPELSPDAGESVDALEQPGRDASPAPDATQQTLDAAESHDAEPADASPGADRASADATVGPGRRALVAVGYGGRRIISYDLGRTWEGNVEDIPNGVDDQYLLRCITYAAGKFVTQGWRTYSSTDARSWANHTAGQDFRAGIDYGNGFFVSAGGGGHTSRSPDGLTWEEHSGVGSNSFRALVFGGGRFVAAGDSGQRASSIDGATWRGVVSGGADLSAIAYGAGRFVAVGSTGRITTSADGEQWNEATSNTSANLDSIMFDGSRFIAGGEQWFLTSPDGLAWNAQRIAGSMSPRFFSDGYYFTMEWNTGIFRSQDAMSWQPSLSYSSNNVRAFAIGAVP